MTQYKWESFYLSVRYPFSWRFLSKLSTKSRTFIKKYKFNFFIKNWFFWKIKNPVDEGFDSKIIKRTEFAKVYTSKLHVPKMMILSVWNFNWNFHWTQITNLSQFHQKSGWKIMILSKWSFLWCHTHENSSDRSFFATTDIMMTRYSQAV